MAAPGQWRRRVLEATLAHKKIAVAVPRGQNDDGDHGCMTGVDGRTQGVNRVANQSHFWGVSMRPGRMSEPKRLSWAAIRSTLDRQKFTCHAGFL